MYFHLRCGPCDGKGYYLLDPRDTCSVCDGKRMIPIKSTENKGTEAAFWRLLHPEVRRVAQKRFEGGHFADAVEAALKEVNDRVKKIAKKLRGQELDGADLMYKVFSPNSPALLLGDLSTATGRSMQEGYMHIFAGAMTGIRNPKAHANIDIDPERAIHFLFLASLLMSKVDEATGSTPRSGN